MYDFFAENIKEITKHKLYEKYSFINYKINFKVKTLHN